MKGTHMERDIYFAACEMYSEALKSLHKASQKVIQSLSDSQKYIEARKVYQETSQRCIDAIHMLDEAFWQEKKHELTTVNFWTPALYITGKLGYCKAYKVAANSTEPCMELTYVRLKTIFSVPGVGIDYSLSIPICNRHAGNFRSVTNKTAQELNDILWLGKR